RLHHLSDGVQDVVKPARPDRGEDGSTEQSRFRSCDLKGNAEQARNDPEQHPVRGRPAGYHISVGDDTGRCGCFHQVSNGGRSALERSTVDRSWRVALVTCAVYSPPLFRLKTGRE